MIENVPGFMTSNGGDDWRMVVTELHTLGYVTDHLTVDASAFLPQSRSRVFLVGHKGGGFALPDPPPLRADLRLAEVAEWDGDWWPAERLGAFLTAMSPLQSERVTAYQRRPAPGFSVPSGALAPGVPSGRSAPTNGLGRCARRAAARPSRQSSALGTDLSLRVG